MLEIGSTFDCLASQCGLRGCTGYRREKGRQSGEFCEFASVSALPFARQTGRTRRKSPLVIWNIPNFQRGVLETGRMFDCLAGLPVTILLLRISLAPPVLPRPKFSAGFRARTSPIPSPSISSIRGLQPQGARLVHETTGFACRPSAPRHARLRPEIPLMVRASGWPRPVAKVSFVTAVVGIGCGVGYYK
jgi:hypothetical protein